MSVSLCNSIVNADGQEITQHGTPIFPVACYHDDLQKETVPWHWHEELEFFIVTEGNSYVDAGHGPEIVYKGQCCFINSSVLHTCRNTDSKTGCRYHSLVFHTNLVGMKYSSVYWRKYIKPLVESGIDYMILTGQKAWQQKIISLVEEAWQVLANEPVGYELIVRNCLSTVILLLYQALIQENTPKISRKTAAKQRDELRIKQMLIFIHEQYENQLTIENIATSASISKSECLRCFHKMLHITPIQYLKDYRLKKAYDMLLTTSLSVTDIALSCGFSELSYFSRSFKEKYKMSPTTVRRK
ncbi:MAG: hypothetical protein ACFWTJ_08695 [Lachnoclostridium sp.]